MKIKVKLLLENNKFKAIEVEKSEVEVIRDLNREQDRFNKSQKAFYKRTISLSINSDEDSDIEVPSNELNPFENHLNDLRKVEIMNSLNKLTKKQKHVVIEHILNEKSFRKIALELNVHHSTISEIYKASIVKLQKILKKIE